MLTKFIAHTGQHTLLSTIFAGGWVSWTGSRGRRLWTMRPLGMGTIISMGMVTQRGSRYVITPRPIILPLVPCGEDSGEESDDESDYSDSAFLSTTTTSCSSQTPIIDPRATTRDPIAPRRPVDYHSHSGDLDPSGPDSSFSHSTQTPHHPLTEPEPSLDAKH